MKPLYLTQHNNAPAPVPLQTVVRKILHGWIKRSTSIFILQICLFVLTGGGIALAQESADALFIDGKGHVGIGINNPRAALDVSGTILGIGMVPPGGITMYHGDINSNFDADGKGLKNTPYEGWQLCNGNNNTPNLLDKFIAMAGGKYTMGAEGGSDSVTLTMDQMPPHNHAGSTGNAQTSIPKVIKKLVKTPAIIKKAKDASGPILELAPVHKHTIPAQGGGKPHENRPQFYALAFIMRLPISMDK